MGGQKGSHDFSPGKAASSAALERALVCLDSGVDDDWNAEAAVASPTMIALFMVTEIVSSRMIITIASVETTPHCASKLSWVTHHCPNLSRSFVDSHAGLPKTPILSTLIVFGVII